MEIIIYNKSFEQLGIIDTYSSLIWIEKYAEVGEFQLSAQATVENVKMCQQGNYIFKTDGETAGIIEYVEIRDTIEEDTLIIKGKLTGILLNNRIIITTQEINNVEQGLYNIIKDNVVNVDSSRRISHVKLATLKGYTDTFITQSTYKELTEALTSICQATGYGYRMAFDTTGLNHIFEAYKGVDRTEGKTGYNGEFSEEFDNLISAKLVKDDSIFKNVAIVAGQGEGEARFIATVGTAKGDNRRELFVDAHDLSRTYNVDVDSGEKDENGNIIYESVEKAYTSKEYTKILTARGQEKLNERLKVLTFDTEIQSTGNMEYKKDYNLGDIVPCISAKFGVKLGVRITEVKTVYEKGENIFVTFGNPQNNLIKNIKKGVI